MTEEMIALARRNVGPANVELCEETVDGPPLPDASADHMTSNRLVNLAPDKPTVFW